MQSSGIVPEFVWNPAQKPALPKIPISKGRRIIANSLAQKCSLARLKKNRFWAGM
jgi:hypothetical protein